MTDWISTKDRLPPAEVEVLVCTDDRNTPVTALALHKTEQFWCNAVGTGNVHDIEDVTHWAWMPTPAMCAGTPRSENHGMTNTPTYGVWVNMRRRCYDPKHPDFKHYGGRGINVCDEWRDSFLKFYEDMGEKPRKLQIDRIDNDGDYCKENCRWTTPSINLTNRRNTSRKYPYLQKKKTVYYFVKRVDGKIKWIRLGPDADWKNIKPIYEKMRREHEGVSVYPALDPG